MPQPVLASSTAQDDYTASPSFVCTWKRGSGAAWIHVAGELDVAASSQLRQALDDAQLDARLVVVDLRELTFIGGCGVDIILNAARNARRDRRALMLVRGPAYVDRVLTLAGASANVWIFDLDPTEPAPALGLV